MGEHKFSGKRPSPRGRGSRSTSTIIVIIIVVAIIGVMNYLQNGGKSAIDTFIPERSKGIEQAPLKIVEFIDFQCSHCKHGSEMLRDFMAEHPDQVRLTIKYFSLGQLNSSMSAYYAQCAARQGKFWEMADQLFATQDNWRSLLKVKDYFNPMAQSIGLDMAALATCIDDKSVHALVVSERELGNAYAIKSTPTYFVNGKMVVGPKELETTLKNHLERESSP